MMKLAIMENIPNPPREKRRMPHLTDEQLRWTLQTRLEKQEELERNGMRNAELWNEISDQFKVKWGQERPCLSLHHRFDKEVAAYREYCRMLRRAQGAGQSKEDVDKIERPAYAYLFEQYAFDVREPARDSSEEISDCVEEYRFLTARQTQPQRQNTAKRVKIAPAPPPAFRPVLPSISLAHPNPYSQPSELLFFNATIINFERIPGSQDNSVRWRPVIQTGAVFVKGRHIVEVVPQGCSLIRSEGNSAMCAMVDVGGRYLMPGLCDAHVRVTANTTNLSSMSDQPRSLITARATRILEGMLMRGFTTVRDAGGADFGLAQAVEEKTIRGPRILFCGHALSQTGGQGDLRKPTYNWAQACSCDSVNTTIGRVCNGPLEVREACRDELRKGAAQIKIMASGGVTNPTDKLKSTQFSEEEIRAAVEEANAVGSYVMAHAYHPNAVIRCIRNGVRSIEHGNHLDRSALQEMIKYNCFLVPTLVAYKHLNNLATDQAAKVGDLVEHGLHCVTMAEDMGVRICYGSDLLGEHHCYQLEGLILQSQAQSACSVLAAATSSCAELFQLEGKVGCIKEGAYADMIVLDRNPLEDLNVLLDPNAMRIIVKDGIIVKNISAPV
mmetsp:Transcript_9200/g.15792  ORF Transcript_9200/g.15792 Transcript_9200/m.15792 type:complete len:613 (+) Transcript_9200:457-2295(+)|eukprot:CAMPEP_0198207972 /NCGR_PEP_ID=MMETSP1445-20131203/11383_1 /TAXON_ID=36898 /ORGANISM="Pyramimonas sp., Strain CCMP2087" /LENGTH=612 /DNA_ID=CAMNT_0043881193 /DNA_START=436 /DNA_END=2274 /DNA_ORIENTATION=-